jgi:DNA-3-methyladenine glycosylase II
MASIEIVPRGPFSLAAARDFAGGFPAGIGGGGVGPGSITLAFPVEGLEVSAAIELWQDPDGVVRGRSDTDGDILAGATRQAARSLSLDHDGSGWPAVGERDHVVGQAQREHDYLRPVCFYSAYEAATSFVIGQRISRRQSGVIKRQLSDELGDRPTIAGVPVPAFPRPARLVNLASARGLHDEKVRRLRGLAQAALDGRLDTERLRSMPPDEAIASLLELPGVGPFTADGVLGSDELGRTVIRELYGLGDVAASDVERISNVWRPYRMWAVVLLRMAWTRAQGASVSYRRG